MNQDGMNVDWQAYSGWIAWSAEGMRVAVMTCLRCGAAVLYHEIGEDGVDPPAIHDAWHLENP